MRRPDEEPSGPQANREDMERMAGATGSSSATGATSTGMQDTAASRSRQPGNQQPSGRSQATYGQHRAPDSSAGTAGYGARTGGALSILAGALAFLQGLAFVIRSHFYPIVPGYAYRWTLHGWGWVLLVLGALLFAGGVSYLLGIKGSRLFTAVVAITTAVVSFLTIFYSVVWGIVVVAACAFAAYNLLSDRGADEGYGSDEDARGPGAQTYGRDERQESMSQGERSQRM